MSRSIIRLGARIAFWCAAVFAYALAILPDDTVRFGFANDKTNHILAFVTLSLLARLGWSRSQAWLIAVLLVAFGGFIELSQAMPLIHRDADLADLIADAAATLIGLLAGTILLLVVRRGRASPSPWRRP